jgi:Tfp pilus assembly protein PilN
VRSINLIPAEQRRGAGGLAGRAGGASYVVVGALAVFVLMAVFYAIAIGQVSSRQSKLTQVTAQTANTQAQAAVLEPYVQFQTIRQQRQAAITSLAASRFDWSDAMDQIARSLPTDVTLSSVAGTAAPAAAAPVVGSPAVAGTGPSVVLSGCATSHSEVATVLVDLNKVDGVSTVSLASSAKSAPAAGSSSSAATSGAGCHGATFNATLTYAAGAGLVSPIKTSNAATATATSPTTGSTR